MNGGKTGAGFQPWPGQAEAGLSGGKKRVAQIGLNPGSGPALAALEKSQTAKKTLGKRILRNVEFMFAEGILRNIKNT